MTPGRVDLKIVAERAAQVRRAVERLRSKGAMERSDFLSDPDLAAATETYLRRALESLADLGRHLLAKSHAEAASGYAEVALKCGEVGFLSHEETVLFRRILGYRNRLVHEYLRVPPEELHDVARQHAGDLLTVLERLEAAARGLASG